MYFRGGEYRGRAPESERSVERLLWALVWSSGTASCRTFIFMSRIKPDCRFRTHDCSLGKVSRRLQDGYEQTRKTKNPAGRSGL